MQQEICQWVVFVKKNSCRGFYSKTKFFFDPLVVEGFILQEKIIWSKLYTEPRHPLPENHMVSTCGFD